MSNSRPFDIVHHLFKPVWEASPDYKGTPYRPTGRDLKEAKEFYALNPTIFDEVIEFQEHAQEYLRSRFEGWVNMKHPCWGLLKHYNAFAPKQVKKETVNRRRLITCAEHGIEHDPFQVCPACQKENEEAVR